MDGASILLLLDQGKSVLLLLANAGSVTDSPLGLGIQFLLLLANVVSVTDK